MKVGKSLRWLAASLVLGAAGPLAAHDMWIEPASFNPPVDVRLAIELRVGHDPSHAEPVTRDSRRYESFSMVTEDGEIAVPGLDGQHPAGFVRPVEPGLHVLVYRGRPDELELATEKFEAYLAEEGLEAISERRRANGRRDEPGRERFSRCLKSLLRVGEDGAAVEGRDRAVGLPLEIIAENVFDGSDGERIFRLLFRGEPIEGVRVDALPLDGGALNGGAEHSARSDDDGRAGFVLEPGRWLIAAVHMVPAAMGEKVDWESFWASTTFELEER